MPAIRAERAESGGDHLMDPIMYTFTQRVVNPLAIDPTLVVIEDLAHQLACINRFCGATKEPISVAQHSVYVSWLSTGARKRQALVHDGGEAYLGDMTKWLKHSPACAGYRLAETAAQKIVYGVFDCPAETDPEVETADRLMVRYEGMQGYNRDWVVGHPAYAPLTAAEVALIDSFCPWQFWSWRFAERMFLQEYERLVGRERAGTLAEAGHGAC